MNLLIQINRFLRDNDMPPTRFGRDAVSDPRFVFDLRNGREPRPSTVAKVKNFMEQRVAAPAIA